MSTLSQPKKAKFCHKWLNQHFLIPWPQNGPIISQFYKQYLDKSAKYCKCPRYSAISGSLVFNLSIYDRGRIAFTYCYTRIQKELAHLHSYSKLLLHIIGKIHAFGVFIMPLLISPKLGKCNYSLESNPDSKVHGANMGPTWVLSAPDGPHDGPTNLAIREADLVVCGVKLHSILQCDAEHNILPLLTCKCSIYSLAFAPWCLMLL